MRPHIQHNGLHRIGDQPARILDNDRFLARDPFDDLWMTRPATPMTNVKAKDDFYELAVALPGFSKDEISIELKDQILIIRAEKKEESEEKEDSFHRKEFETYKLARTFNLPASVNEDEIRAKLETGILKISIPVSQTNLKRKIEVL